MELAWCVLVCFIPSLVYGEGATYTERSLVRDEGNNLEDFFGVGLATCKKKCGTNKKCKSFAYGKKEGDCHLKDREVTRSDLASTMDHGVDGTYVTYFKKAATHSPPKKKSASQEPNYIYVKRTLVAMEGKSVGDFFGVGLGICKQKCDATSGCNSFSFTSGTGDCHLKDRAVTANEPATSMEHGVDGRFVTYFKQATTTTSTTTTTMTKTKKQPAKKTSADVGPNTYLERTLVAVEGNSIGDFFGVDLATCKARCDATFECNSFAFAAGAGDCHLKDRVVGHADEASSIDHGLDGTYVTYFRKAPTNTHTKKKTAYVGPNTYVERTLVAVEGNTIEDWFGVDLATCKTKCDAIGGCNSFAFTADSGDCHLKDRIVTGADLASQMDHGVDGSYVTYFKQVTATRTTTESITEIEDDDSDEITEEEVMQEVDKDGDRMISLAEVFEFLRTQSDDEATAKQDKKIFKKAFKESDIDEDGLITMQELPDMLEAINAGLAAVAAKDQEL